MAKSSADKSIKADHRVYAGLDQLCALQHQARGFSFLPKQAVHSVLVGRHASRLRGRGLNFEELRHYRVGDDIRTMDWKVSNRTGKPHVRVYTEERERPVLLVVDQRQSMFFGSQQKMKSVVAAEATALAAWRVLAVGDCVGALVFNDQEIVAVKPRRSRNTVMQILQHTLRMNHALAAGSEQGPGAGQLNRALAEAERLCGHDYLVVVISDMNGWNDATVRSIKRLSRHNDIIATLIYDPLEKQLPRHQLIVSDGALQIEVDARKTGLQQQFTREFVSGVDFLQGELRKYQVPVITTDTVHPVQDQIRQAMGNAQKRRRQ
jgi:uncharacterized protein (DUF58 family)